MRNSATNAGMFISAMRHALGQQSYLEAFQADRGITAPARGLSPLDQLIDQSTGADRALFESFAQWFAENYWGSKNAPDMSVIFKPDPEA